MTEIEKNKETEEMAELAVKNTTCPSCGREIEYWTQNNIISCSVCRKKIDVEPCEEVQKEVD